MNERVLFFKKFLQQGVRIASVSPSSSYLSRATCANIDWATAKVIVELGAGTGPITEVIVNNARPDCRIITIELDHDLAEVLKRKFADKKNVEVIEGDCGELTQMLEERNISSVDHIVSALPTPTLPKAMQEKIFATAARFLKPEGYFNQITEFPLVFLPFYKKHFEEVKFSFIPLNIPPSGFYACRRVKKG
jgi:phospholipid N-methyltransferase